jgi:ABC-type transport system involved in cytochrome c biogenesis permease subunit
MQLLACLIGAVGLMVHFGMHLVSFLRRRAVPTRFPSGAPVPPRMRTAGSYQLAPTTLPLLARPTFWAGVAAVVIGVSIIGAMAVRPAMKQPAPYDYAAFGRLPVVSDGRVLPLDSVARNTLRIVRGRETLMRGTETVPAIQWLTEAFASADEWRNDKIFRIDHPDILSLFQLDAKEKYFSVNDLGPHMDELSRQAQMASQITQGERDSFQSKVLQLAESVRLLSKVIGGFHSGEMYVVPPTKGATRWLTLDDVVKQRQKTGKDAPESAVLFTQIIEDFRQHKPASFNGDIQKYQQFLDTNASQITTKTSYEAYLNAFDPFLGCIVLYVIVLVLGILSWLFWQKQFTAAALALLALTLVVHTFGLGSRIWLQGRPPVTNLYSSAVFIGWGAVALCVFLELIYRNGIASVTAAIMGFVTLIIAMHLESDATLQPNGDTMAVMRAVLDTNLWLATHVVCITLGYAATFLAGALALIYVIRGAFTSSLDPELRKTMTRMIYAIVCFAMFFSFVGTILGGIWADQSWGRFWGWDPKENGAILIVLWNALILHARWSGLVRDRGLALLAIFGNVVTSWSWFGTNMLGIGLHSYGFMDAAVPWLIGFDLFQIAVIGIGLIPQHLWLSFARSESESPLAMAHR